ncbi:uncharacterized protein G2W53_020589 [Senna tora]|uniref:Uncharacterized protein n=1 Tax=Senna tora TaxID=362788 RepID=A0A834TVQ4_9FABA|nr:uncharacterized protein G2W53_020589 [Senna tora]
MDVGGGAGEVVGVECVNDDCFDQPD